MDNQEMRELKERLGIINYRVAYKTGVHLGVVESFFDRKSDEIDPVDRARIEALLTKEANKK